MKQYYRTKCDFFDFFDFSVKTYRYSAVTAFIVTSHVTHVMGHKNNGRREGFAQNWCKQ